MEGINLTKKKTHKKHSTVHKKQSSSHKKHHAHKRSFPWVYTIAFLVLVVVVVGVLYFFTGLNRGGDAAAVVNGEEISMEYLNEQYARIPPQYKEFVTKGVLLNQTINEMILLQEAKRQGVSVSEDEVQASIDDAMSVANLSESEMVSKLAEQNLTLDFLKDLYNKQMTINKLLEKVLFSDIKVTKSEVKAEYDSQIHAAHILVENESEAKDLIR